MFNKSAHSLAINDFLSAYKLTIGQRGNAHSAVAGDVSEYYTFSNEKLNRYNTIDFICFSSFISEYLVTYDTMHNALNHSDHLSVSAVFNIPDVCNIYELFQQCII